jgi:hypothetical protein
MQIKAARNFSFAGRRESLLPEDVMVFAAGVEVREPRGFGGAVQNVGGVVAGIITSKSTRFAAPPIFGREDRSVLGAPRQELSEPSASRWLTLHHKPPAPPDHEHEVF